MRQAVKFDCNVALCAEKIDNITTYAVLPSELFAEDLPSLKVGAKEWPLPVWGCFSSLADGLSVAVCL